MGILRESIQKLTRSVNPLGKLMDFLQEDFDSMQMELVSWRNGYVKAKDQLKHESGYYLFILNNSLLWVNKNKHTCTQVNAKCHTAVKTTISPNRGQHRRAVRIDSRGETEYFTK